MTNKSFSRVRHHGPQSLLPNGQFRNPSIFIPSKSFSLDNKELKKKQFQFWWRMETKSLKHIEQGKSNWSYNCSFRGKNAMKQLQKCFLHFLGRQTRDCKRPRGTNDYGTVKKGHFSVLVLSNGEPQKFAVALRYLAHPSFIELLNAAEQEFGFNQKGVLVIPCEAGELQRILSHKHVRKMGNHTDANRQVHCQAGQ